VANLGRGDAGDGRVGCVCEEGKGGDEDGLCDEHGCLSRIG